MKIYTKAGDKGETGFIGGRISKSSSLMDTIGSLDELSAHLGIVATQAKSAKLDILHEQTTHIQNIIFNYGALIADVGGQNHNKSNQTVGKNDQIGKEVAKLEAEIDKLDAELPVLQNFILAGGSPVASHLHLARTVCRRAERSLVKLITDTNSLDFSKEYLLILEEILKYFNRLSDWLFTYARWANKKLEVPDVEWNKAA